MRRGSVRIILIGAPGAGKDTQAHKLSSKLAIPRISTGALFRESVGAATQPGMAAKHSCKPRRVNVNTRRTTDRRMMITAKQVAAHRGVTCPAHHLGLGMA
jgi:adenylate kinase family enzyme